MYDHDVKFPYSMCYGGRKRTTASFRFVYYGLFRYVLSNNLNTVKSGRTFWFTCVDERSLKLTCNCALLFTSDFLYAFCLERVDIPVTVALQYFAPLIAR